RAAVRTGILPCRFCRSNGSRGGFLGYCSSVQVVEVRTKEPWERCGRAASAARLFSQVAQDRLERLDDLVAAGAALRDAELQVERLGRRPVGECVVLRPAHLRPRGLLADLLARGAALAGDFLDEGGHFRRGLLPNDLEKQRLRGNVGQPTKGPDLVGYP